jgi:hypothetical protein
MGPVAQIISSRFGSRATLMLGTLCKSLGLIIAGWGKEPWQLIICQGLIFGSGCSFTYVVSEYQKKIAFILTSYIYILFSFIDGHGGSSTMVHQTTKSGHRADRMR